MSYRILILEDNELLLETLEDFLNQKGCLVSLAKSVQEADTQSFKKYFDLFLLDIKLAKSSGFEFLKALREAKDFTPAIFLTSAVDKQSIVRGFTLGADDYIKKPFDLDELWMRINAVTQRNQGRRGDRLHINEQYYLDLEQKILIHNNKQIDINQKDFELLTLLVQNRAKVVTKEMIRQRLWRSNEEVNEGSIRVYINNIKKIFGKKSITNIRGVGYRFES